MPVRKVYAVQFLALVSTVEVRRLDSDSFEGNQVNG